MLYATEKRRAVTAILLVFMFIFAELVIYDEDSKTGLESRDISNTISTQQPSQIMDSYISEVDPNTNFENSNNIYVGESNSQENRSILKFSNTLQGASESIIHANLTLVCEKLSSLDMNIEPMLFSAGIKSAYTDSEVTWNNIDNSIAWTLPGAKSLLDRTHWELKADISPIGNNQYEAVFNVTNIVQNDLLNQNSNFDFLLSGVGGHYTCAGQGNQTQSFHPILELEVMSGNSLGGGGSAVADFANDGQALMTPDFILAPDTTPTFSYNSMVGNDLEFQFSLSNDFRNYNDGEWHFSSMNNPFTTAGNTGEFTVPSTDSLTEGNKIHYRYRAYDNTSMAGSWSFGDFLLPSFSVTDNLDGTATISLNNDNFTLGDLKLIEDTYVENQQTTPQGASQLLKLSTLGSDTKSFSHVRVNSHLLGLHSNSSIINGEINLVRSTNNQYQQQISVHTTANSWTEGQATMSSPTTGQTWTSGGIADVSTSVDHSVLSDQTQPEFDFDISYPMQRSLSHSQNNPLNLVLLGEPTSELTNSQLAEITFHSTESTVTNSPSIEITYRWANNASVVQPELVFPINNQATWNITGGNLSGDTMPNMQWNNTASQFSGCVLEISTDSYFKNVIVSIDERTSQTNSLGTGAYQLSTQEHLEIGKQYYWRMLNYDNDSLTSEWNESSFFVSNLVSSWLGGDQHKLTISPADEPDLSNIPDFDYSVISSAFPDTSSYGYPYLYVNDNPSQGVSKTIFGISLDNYVLPSGLAVISSELALVTTSHTSNPEVGLWALNNSDWVAAEVTWNQYDATNAWNSPGASSQLDRTNLLDKQQITSTGQVTYNITSEVQSRIRNSQPLDLMLEIMPGYSNSNVVFGSKYSLISSMPTLDIIYVEGSNQIPSTPVALSPFDGQWLYNDSFLLEPNTIPELNWTVSANPPISGWAVEIDTDASFSSNDKISVESWNDVGFDVTNSTYQLQSSLDIGKTWYWKVRGLTQTYQLGDWSPEFRFHLADLDSSIISNDIITTSYSNSSVIEDLQVPYFVDMDVETGLLQNNPSSSNILRVGTTNSATDSMALIKIPIDYNLNPTNARLTSATLDLYSESFSTPGLDIALREVLVPWTLDANGLQYNDTGNWSQTAGRGIGLDIGAPIDIQSSVNGWMSFNLTYLAQQALQSGSNHISVALYAESAQPGDIVYYLSSDSTQDRPTINFTWQRGAVTPPADLPVIISPVPGDIYFNETSHALLPSLRPSFSWSMPANSVSNPDNWRIFIILNSTNDMAGQLMFDSRTNPEYFDLANHIFTPPVDISHANFIEWYVQPVESDMIGIPSNISSYYIPSSVGQELSSTDASLTIQDGSLLEELNLPELTSDIYLDQGNPNSPNTGDSLFIGNSSILNTNTSTSSAIVSFNLSLLPQLADFQVLNATLVLTAVGGFGTVDISASRMLTYWDENSTFVNSSIGNPWINPGALRGGDSDIPESLTQVTGLGQHQWDITHMLQMLVESGSPELSILLQPEIIFATGGLIDGNFEFAGSENPTVSLRPKIELNYRVGHQWLPPAPSSLIPANNDTVWNQNSNLPSTPDEINYTVASSISNETSWTFCRGFDYRWLDCESTDNLSTDDFAWDSVSNTLSFNNTSEITSQAGDEWQYYRVRTNQNHNLGYYSPINKIRVPTDQGTDDGLGNYTIEFTRASIFDLTGVLPQTEDSSVDSIGNAITGGDNSLIVGYNPITGGQSAAYVEFNLSSIPFIPNAMPTSMIIELTSKNSLFQQNPITIGIESCESTDEYTTNYTNSPNCTGTELTRTTVSSSANPKVQWDVTYLAQQNFLAQNMTFSFKLESTTVSSTYFEFLSSENQLGKPKLILTYVDNIAGVTPPSQPTLISPSDSEILYDTSGVTLQTVSQTSLTWSPVTSASSYKVFIDDKQQVTVYDSLYDSEINGNTLTSSQFIGGETYTWWVQAYTQNIPGPSSARWTFALGDPVHYSNNDGTYTYEFIDSKEVADFSHINVYDTTISDALPGNNFGQNPNIIVGNGCLQTQTSNCAGIFSIDFSQIPLDYTAQSLHSMDVEFTVESWDFTGGAYEIEFSVHEFLHTSWNELSLTWNSTGATPGLIAGVDYVAAPIDVVRYSNTDNLITFNIGSDGTQINDEKHWVIIGTAIGTGSNTDGFVNLYSSEPSTQVDKRPKVKLNHTAVNSLTISTQSTVFDADNQYQFDLQSFDYLGQAIANNLPTGASIEWSTTTGTIQELSESSITLTPTTSGTQIITACYGLICTDYQIIIDSGLPVELFASFSQSSSQSSITIDADAEIDVFAYAIDQHGNLVTGETISFSTTNGSIGQNDKYYPYLVGNQIITAQWIGVSSTLAVDLYVEVLPGAPNMVELSGCDYVVDAGTSCDLFATLYDQFGNLVWLDMGGEYSLSSTNGETDTVLFSSPNELPPVSQIKIGEFTGDSIGTWSITINSDNGLSDQIDVIVSYGEIQSLILEASQSTISADDLLYLNATRVDVRGNELLVEIMASNWSDISDGQITSGIPSVWTPNLQGTKTITGSFEGITESVTIFVTRGSVSQFHILVDDEVANNQLFEMTADESLSSSLRAIDSKGNTWIVEGTWEVSHNELDTTGIISSNNSSQTTFNPVFASFTSYTITATHVENGITFTESFSVLVSVGDIEELIVTGIDSKGVEYDIVDGFVITADEFIQFTTDMFDADGNTVVVPIFWNIIDLGNSVQTNITGDLDSNIWDATLVGEYSISVYTVNQRGFNLSSQFEVIVSHGTPVYLEIVQSTNTQNAGDIVTLQVTGTDFDGNQFAQPVVWLENNGQAQNINSTINVGGYEFNGRSAGNYTLTAEYLAISSSVEVEVFALNIAANLKYNVSTDILEQLETLTVSIEVYDEYWNPISVPENSRVDTTDRGDVTYLGNGVWELETLDEGGHSATIVIGSLTETFTYDVEGNLAGFFAAGGPLYYVGAGLIGLIVVALLVFLVRLVRGDGEYYDEDDEDDYSYTQDSEPAKDFTQTTISKTPVVPTPPTRPPSQPEEAVVESEDQNDEDLTWAVDYRIEDDGTEWGQTDEEIWYYRESGSDDWVEWTE